MPTFTPPTYELSSDDILFGRFSVPVGISVLWDGETFVEVADSSVPRSFSTYLARPLSAPPSFCLPLLPPPINLFPPNQPISLFYLQSPSSICISLPLTSAPLGSLSPQPPLSLPLTLFLSPSPSPSPSLLSTRAIKGATERSIEQCGPSSSLKLL